MTLCTPIVRFPPIADNSYRWRSRRMTTQRLEVIRWLLILLSFAAILMSWLLGPKGGWALLRFFFLGLPT